MERYCLVFTIFLGLALTKLAFGQCPEDWKEYDNYCWYFSRGIGRDLKDTFTGASSFCQTRGADLAIFNTVEQRDYAYDQVKAFQPSRWWIGMTDFEAESQFKWVDGTEVSSDVRFWKQGEPSNTGGEDCVEMWVELPLYRGRWNDASCDKIDNFVCRGSLDMGVQSCESGWTKGSTSCYRTFTTKYMWQEANAFCGTYGGRLTSITSSQEQITVQNLVQNTGIYEDFWIGLSDTADGGNLQWSTFESYSYSNFLSAATPNDPPYEGSSCAVMDPNNNYKWDLVKCSNEYNIICEKGFKATCPTGWTFLADKCYEFIVNPNRATSWTNALATCNLEGGGLLKIETKEQQDNLAGALEQYYNSGADLIWIGGSDIGHDDSFTWWDNTPLAIKYWDDNMPKATKDQYDCMAMYSGSSDHNNWETTSCFFERQFICELPEGSRLPQLDPVVVDGKCKDGWRWFKTGYCFFFGNSEKSQSQAKVFCENLSDKDHPSTLASVLSTGEMSFIVGHMQQDSWIGLENQGGQYTWLDSGNEVQIVNWDGSATKNKQCVFAKEDSGLWVDDSCSQYHTFVCKTNEIEITPVAPTPPDLHPDYEKCGGNGWFSNPSSSSCYKVDAGRTRTWNDARAECQNHGGDLISINTPEENAFIHDLTQQLGFAANLWIGASDKMSWQDDVVDVYDGGWSWSDGSPFNYLNWESGEPNNSGEEDCAELYLATGRWNDDRCARTRHFICEKIGDTGNTIIGTDVAQSECRSNEACCFRHLGVEKGGAIPDSFLSVSSFRDVNFNATRGRLNMQDTVVVVDAGPVSVGAHGAWEPDDDDQETSWFQVDFLTYTEFKGIITQGRNNFNGITGKRQWTTSYRISYSQDPENTKENVQNWEFLKDSTGNDIIFEGNKDKDTQVTNLFPRPIVAKHIRCHPLTYNDRVALRLEYIGCTASCLYNVGMNSGYITDSMLSSSTGDAKQGRPPAESDQCLTGGDNGQGYRGWLSKTSSGLDCQPWALQTPHTHPYNPRDYQDDGLTGNACRNPGGDKDRPWCYTTEVSVEWEYCNVPTCPNYVPTGWQPSSSNTNQWIQVAFDDYYKVSGITTYSGSSSWVKTYKLQFGEVANNLRTYENQNGDDHIFYGNNGANSQYTDIVREPISTLFLRIVPQSWQSRITLQFEINGCYADRLMSCADKASQYEEEYFTATCPGGCAEDFNKGLVYGTDTYTESSAICPAAIHAGRLVNNHGGVVEVTKTGGKNSYEGTVRHGVSSLSYGVAQQSMIFNGRAYRCDDGWYAWKDHCYYLAPEGGAKTWTEARADCKSMGGDLASIWSTAENDFLSTLFLQSPNGFDVWIGLNALDVEYYYVWSDGSDVTITNWWINEPAGREERCGKMYVEAGLWGGKECARKYPYFCKKEKQLLPPVTTISPPVDEGCEVGWKAYGYSCYWTSRDRVTYFTADRVCQDMGGHLVTIQDHYEQSFVHAYFTASVPAGVGYTSWIGMSAKSTETGAQTYQWETNEPIDYTYWDAGEPDVLLKCSFPFKYTLNTYYECTTQANRLVPDGAAWCSVTPTFVGLFLICGNDNPQGCGYIDEVGGRWRMDLCTDTRHYTCEKTRGGFTEPTYTTRDTQLGKCADGWISNDNLGDCYQVNEFANLGDRTTWFQARDYCQAQRGDLISLQSDYEQIEVGQLIQDHGVNSNTHFWLGLNSISNNGGYSWSDGTGVYYTNWAPGEPNDHQGKENCVESTIVDNAQWNDINCDALRNFICKIRKNVPVLPPPTIPPPLGTDDGGCGEGWVQYTTEYGIDKCYKFVNDTAESWQRADLACQGYGGHLVAIHDEQENSVLLSRAARATSYAMWIGIRNIGGGSFQWSDSSLVDYTNWGPGEPNNYLNSEDCADMAADRGLWNDDNCGLRKPFICEKCSECGPVVIPPTIAPTGGCPDGYTLYGNKCYFSSGNMEYNWDTALEYCRNNSAELAVINNEYEQAFLASYMYGVSENVWIGFHSRYIGGPYVWSDQSSTTYVAWDGGQPDNYNNQEACTELWLGPLSTGRWNDDRCDQPKTFSCYVRRDEQYFGSPPPPSIECPNGYYPWNRGCYLLVTDEKRTFAAARDYCQTLGNDLLNIDTVYENELLHSWFWKGQLSLTDTLWTGMVYEVSSSGDGTSSNTTFSWTNGWPAEFTKWGPGQPATDDMSGCVYMDSAGGWFATSDCSTTRPFVCKQNLDPIPTEPPIREGYCDPGFAEYNEFCYYFNPGVTDATSRSWFEARAECQAHGADLASFHSSKELNAFIASIQGQSSHNLYIGLYSNGFDGFVWSDGSAVEYTNWNDNEPNGLGNGEECGEMYPWNGAWNDVSCYEDRGYVCKKPAGYTRCNVPDIARIECGYDGITQTYCVTHRGCCYDAESITANFSGCFWAENTLPPGFTFPPDNVSANLSGGAIAGIVIGCLLAVAAVVGLVFYLKQSGKSIPSMPSFSTPSFRTTKPPERKGGFDNPMAQESDS